jgi:hypothetical protein
MQSESFPGLVEAAAELTEQMHVLARQSQWVDVQALDRSRQILLSEVQRRLGERDQHPQARTLLRHLFERNDSLRIICEQAREDLYAQIRTANRSRVAMQAYGAT